MSESEKEKKIFLSYCGSRDQELLTGRKKMTLGDMERFSFLTEFFGLESYGLNLWKEFGDDVEEPLDALIKLLDEWEYENDTWIDDDGRFSKGTLEWRCFESTLHAGKVRANITLALAISAQAINQRSTQMKKTPISENPAFTFRTFLLRLGLIGEEYKNVRKHLLANLEGDLAWRYDKSTYECLKKKQRTDDVRSR